jgi:hypothetical protein
LGGKFFPLFFNNCEVGGIGLIRGNILISLVFLLPFLKLHGLQAATTFVQFVLPP